MVQAQEAFFAVFVANPALAEADVAALVAGAPLLEDEHAVAVSNETVGTAATAAPTRCLRTKSFLSLERGHWLVRSRPFPVRSMPVHDMVVARRIVSVGAQVAGPRPSRPSASMRGTTWYRIAGANRSTYASTPVVHAVFAISAARRGAADSVHR